ncbi:hypothetical protein L9F63_004124, partial [Diploptera punctata]
MCLPSFLLIAVCIPSLLSLSQSFMLPLEMLFPRTGAKMYSITKRAALAPPGSFFWGIVHRAKLLELKAKVTCLKCSGIFQRGRCLDCKGFPPYPKLSIQATFVINEVDGRVIIAMKDEELLKYLDIRPAYSDVIARTMCLHGAEVVLPDKRKPIGVEEPLDKRLVREVVMLYEKNRIFYFHCRKFRSRNP